MDKGHFTPSSFIKPCNHLTLTLKNRLTQAFASVLAPLVVTITLLTHQHPLQLFSLLLFPLAGKLGTGLLVLQHVLNVLSHLFKVTVLSWAAVCVCGEHLCWLQHSVVEQQQRKLLNVRSEESLEYMQRSISLVLQVKDPLALFLVAFLVFSNGETRPPGKLAHGTLAWTRLLCGHGPHHVNHLPAWELLDLMHK